MEDDNSQTPLQLLKSWLENVSFDKKCCEQFHDVKLIANDGELFAHSVVLQAVSPVLYETLNNEMKYDDIKIILLPEYTKAQVEGFLHLVYTGFSPPSLTNDPQNIHGLAVDLGLTNIVHCQKLSNCKEWDTIPPFVGFKEFMKESSSRHLVDASVSPMNIFKSPDNDDKNNSPGNNPICPTPKIKRCTKKRTVINGKSYGRIITEAVEKFHPKFEKIPAVIDISSSEEDSDDICVVAETKKNETAEDWTEPNYKDKTWFENESLRCQFCSKIFDSPIEASYCIIGHNKLRCYLCFTVHNSSAQLYSHYKLRHVENNSESPINNGVKCPYCNASCDFRDISTHVINLHLISSPHKEEKNMMKTSLRNNNNPTDSNKKRKKSISISPTYQKTPKSLKLSENSGDMLRVPDLDVTIKRRSISGAMIVYKLQKKREKY